MYYSKEIGDYYTTDSIDSRIVKYNYISKYDSVFNNYKSNSIFIYKRTDFKEKTNKGKVKLHPFFIEEINNIPVFIEEFATDDKLVNLNIDNHTFEYNYYNDTFSDIKFNRLVDVNNLVYSEDFNIISEIIVYDNAEKEKFYQENKVTENINFQTNFSYQKQKVDLVENMNMDVLFFDDMAMAYSINCENSSYPFCFKYPYSMIGYPNNFRDQSEEIILQNKNYFFIDKITIKNNPPVVDMDYLINCSGSSYLNSSGNTKDYSFFKTGQATDLSSYSVGINSFAYYLNNYSLTTFNFFKNKHSDFLYSLYNFINLQIFKFNNTKKICNVEFITDNKRRNINHNSCIKEGEAKKFVQKVNENYNLGNIEECSLDLNVLKIDINNTKNLTIDYIPSDKFNSYYASLEKEDVIKYLG